MIVFGSVFVIDAFADTPNVSLDRMVYPVPFGGVDDFDNPVSSLPDGRSLFPVHQSGIIADTLQESDTLDAGDLIVHIRIIDDIFDISSQGMDEISQDIDGKTVGPLKISLSRDTQTMVLAYAGGSTPNKNGLVDVGDDNPNNALQLGPISEIAPDAGMFELDFVIRYTDGPSSTQCPNTAMFASLNNDASQNTEESRFDLPSPEGENYCILKDDVLTVEYSRLDASGKVLEVLSDSATFDLRDGLLKSDKSTYVIGSDMILTLVEPDFDLDNDVSEIYDLDLIEWDSDAATLTLGDLGGEGAAFDPEPLNFRETGDSTGIFQIVVEIPEKLHDDYLERGEAVLLEYTDWGPSSANRVGQQDNDIQWTIHTSNFGATIELDKKIYSWTDKVHITVTAKDHNFDGDLIDEIGENNPYPLTISTWNSTLNKYKLVETGPNTGIFTGNVELTGFLHNADGNDMTGDVDGADTTPKTSGMGPTDGFLESNSYDGLTVSFEFSEDEIVVGSALIQWSTGQIRWLEESYSSGGTGVVRVIDPDMNLNPSRLDNFDICVWSDSDAGGIDLTVTETNNSSGIFEGTVFFSTTDESSGHRLRVLDGDTITAEYEDNTLPAPYAPSDDLDVIAKSLIKELLASPLKQQLSGILPQDVICNKGLEKFFKYDGSAICANPLSVEKLVYRGWGTSDMK